ncbi:MAG: hypothetical protein N4A49_07240 [Marinifilaceae bacterium]|jgi:hypothetical protein|nr:hypothetical protein [Marinifilaceae bacterium]
MGEKSQKSQNNKRKPQPLNPEILKCKKINDNKRKTIYEKKKATNKKKRLESFNIRINHNRSGLEVLTDLVSDKMEDHTLVVTHKIASCFLDLENDPVIKALNYCRKNHIYTIYAIIDWLNRLLPKTEDKKAIISNILVHLNPNTAPRIQALWLENIIDKNKWKHESFKEKAKRCFAYNCKEKEYLNTRDWNTLPYTYRNIINNYPPTKNNEFNQKQQTELENQITNKSKRLYYSPAISENLTNLNFFQLLYNLDNSKEIENILRKWYSFELDDYVTRFVTQLSNKSIADESVQDSINKIAETIFRNKNDIETRNTRFLNELNDEDVKILYTIIYKYLFSYSQKILTPTFNLNITIPCSYNEPNIFKILIKKIKGEDYNKDLKTILDDTYNIIKAIYENPDKYINKIIAFDLNRIKEILTPIKARKLFYENDVGDYYYYDFIKLLNKSITDSVTNIITNHTGYYKQFDIFLESNKHLLIAMLNNLSDILDQHLINQHNAIGELFRNAVDHIDDDDDDDEQNDDVNEHNVDHNVEDDSEDSDDDDQNEDSDEYSFYNDIEDDDNEEEEEEEEEEEDEEEDEEEEDDDDDEDEDDEDEDEEDDDEEENQNDGSDTYSFYNDFKEEYDE